MKASGRMLRAVLFMDTVSSTEIAAEIGDNRWRELVRRQRVALRRELKRFRGDEIDTAGDGMFAVFPQPDEAIRCAVSSSRAVQDLGLDIRAGIHFGECQLSDGLAQGIVVHTGARVMGLAGPGEVLVSGTVRELVAGSRFRFEERGQHELRGVPGNWPVFAVADVDGVTIPVALDPETARTRREQIGPERNRRRTRGLALAAVGLIAAIVTSIAVIDRPTPPEATPDPPPSLPFDSLVRLDVDEGALTVTARGLPALHSEIGGLVAGEGAVWAVDSVLHHFDPVTGIEETEGVDLDISSSLDTHPVAIGYQSVWVATIHEVLEVDPADDEVSRRLAMDRTKSTLGNSTFPVGMTTGAGSIWVIWNDGHLLRLDRGGRIEADILVGELPAGILFEGNRVWVTDEFTGDVVEVDPRTNQIARTISIGGSPNAMAWLDGQLWVVDRNQGVIVGVDPRTEERIESIPVGPSPIDIESGLGFLWVADQSDGSVRQMDPRGNEIARHDMGVELSAIAIDEERRIVWLRTSGRIPDLA